MESIFKKSVIEFLEINMDSKFYKIDDFWNYGIGQEINREFIVFIVLDG